MKNVGVLKYNMAVTGHNRSSSNYGSTLEERSLGQWREWRAYGSISTEYKVWFQRNKLVLTKYDESQ